ncbi:endonuclease III [Abyssisolibacter fermentans]|uniref:endonuclease III n=1 Tax=Abyssisolibacter fermentans TaxID=1766203 RepID=UPI0008363294|nr:endonuclease III [Abyssisolibacter fermentans]
MDKKIAIKLLDILEKTYPDAECELKFDTPFQLLIATILSAQSTDKRVNEVTKDMFKKYSKPKDYLNLSQEELGEIIRSIGFYRNKSKNILNTCSILIQNYNSELPNNMEELMKLPGVGRKTANVVLSNAFGKPAIAVDTHVFRVSNRLGLANSDNVNDTEKQLMKIIPKQRWSRSHHLLIFHGRRTCKARKPECFRCPILEICKYKDKNIDSSN